MTLTKQVRVPDPPRTLRQATELARIEDRHGPATVREGTTSGFLSVGIERPVGGPVVLEVDRDGRVVSVGPRLP